MPRYFLHVITDFRVEDYEGSDFADDQAAVEAAREEALDLAAMTLRARAIEVPPRVVEVVDAEGRFVHAVSLADVALRKLG